MEKKRNPLSALGFLGISGVVGLWAGSPSLTLFLLFFFFFTYQNKPADELFWLNVRRAGLRAFAVGTGFGMIAYVIIICRGFWLTGKGLLFQSWEEFSAVAVAAQTEFAVTIPSGYFLQSQWIMAGFNWMLLLALCTFLLTLMQFNRREKKYTGEDDPC